MDSQPPKAMRQLVFNAKISGKMPVADLVKKLKDLHGELKEMLQDETDTSSLTQYAQELVKPDLMKHSDKGVKVLVACSLAEILKLYAPDAPYKKSVLDQILHMFVEQFRSLNDVHGPNIKRSYILLENLATVRTLILLTDQDDKQNIMSLFQIFFDVVSEEHPDAVRGCMVDIMEQLVEELDDLPSDLVEIVLSQFVPKKRSSAVAQLLAGDLVRNSSKKFQSYITRFFQDVHSGDLDGTSSEIATPEIAHNIVIQLYKSAPNALVYVIPQLEEALRNTDSVPRELAVRTLGEMFSQPRSALIDNYSSAWQQWLDRGQDVDPKIRIERLSFVAALLVNHPSHSTEINETTRTRMLDLDEKVRQAVCKTLGELPDEAIKRLTKETIDGLLDRCIDKKPAVRTVAIQAAASIFASTLGKVYQKDNVVLDPSQVDLVSPLLAKLLSNVMNTEEDIRKESERIITEDFIPSASGSEKDIAKALCGMYSLLLSTKGARNGLQLLFQLQAKCQKEAHALFEILTEANNDDKQPDNRSLIASAGQKIIALARLLPDPLRTQDNLKKIVELKDVHLFKALAAAFAGDATHAAIHKARDQAIVRLKAKPTLTEDVKTLIQRCSLSLLNRSVVGAVLSLVNEWKDGTTSSSMRLLEGGLALIKDLSMFTPHALSPLFGTLLDWLSADDSDIVGNCALEVIANGWNFVPAEGITTAKNVRRILEDAAKSSVVERAAHAIRVLCALPDTKTLLKNTIQSLVNELSDDKLQAGSGSESWAELSSALSALAEVVVCAPASFEQHGGDVVEFVIKQLLPSIAQTPRSPSKAASKRKDASSSSKKSHGDDDAEDEDDGSTDPPKFIDDADLPNDLAAKLAGVRFLGRFLTAPSLANSKETIEEPFSALYNLLDNHGEPREEKPFTRSSYKARLHLAAGESILTLAGLDQFSAIVNAELVLSLALLLQSPLQQVRAQFFARLYNMLTSLKLPIMYMALLFFSAPVETEKEHLDVIKRQIQALVASRRKLVSEHKSDPSFASKVLPEYAFPHLLFLVAHHPDFSTDDLHVVAKYIESYIDAVLTSENLSFLFQIAQQIKVHFDVVAKEESERLYVMSDLSMLVIQDRAKSNSWAIETYPGTVSLPVALFRPLPLEVANKNARRSYLPEGFQLDGGRKYGLGGSKSGLSRPANVRSTPAKSPTAKSSKSPLSASASKSTSTTSLKALTSSTAKRALAFEDVAAPPSPSRRNPTRSSKVNGKSMVDVGSSDVDEKDDEMQTDELEEEEGEDEEDIPLERPSKKKSSAPAAAVGSPKKSNSKKPSATQRLLDGEDDNDDDRMATTSKPARTSSSSPTKSAPSPSSSPTKRKATAITGSDEEPAAPPQSKKKGKSPSPPVIAPAPAEEQEEDDETKYGGEPVKPRTRKMAVRR